jgi:hypothetical protein
MAISVSFIFGFALAKSAKKFVLEASIHTVSGLSLSPQISLPFPFISACYQCLWQRTAFKILKPLQ